MVNNIILPDECSVTELGCKVSEFANSSIMALYRPFFQFNTEPLGLREMWFTNIPETDTQNESKDTKHS